MAEILNDATLLDRFVRLREEDAFAALVRRHGPAVLSVCRRFLRSEHDVEDVFQSTFLVLARKAPGIAWQGSVEGWLRDVARRLALHARTGASRRSSREKSLVACGADRDESATTAILDEEPERAAELSDLKRVLAEALEQLPEKYRAPVVLCYLEGKTNEEAARQLGWPAGSMSRRLERGRSLLRQSLAGHGLALTIGLACLASIVLQSLNSTRRAGLGPRAGFAPIRAAMRPFRPQDQGKEGARDVLSRLVDGRSSTSAADRDRAAELAELTARAGAEIEDFDPGRDRLAWRASAAEMRRSAAVLAQAARAGDGPAMAAAARRLDATCVRCHAWFHAGSSLESASPGSGVWPSPRWLDKMN
jgi:RNA polymerase sigma-70 factor (ECF subfamily)